MGAKRKPWEARKHRAPERQIGIMAERMSRFDQLRGCATGRFQYHRQPKRSKYIAREPEILFPARYAGFILLWECIHKEHEALVWLPSRSKNGFKHRAV